MRIIQITMLVSILLYLVIVVSLAPHGPQNSNPIVLIAVTFFSVMSVGAILLIRRVMVLRAEEVLRTMPDDAAAQARWRGGFVITYAIAEAIALFGLVLRFIGFTLMQALPFFLAGFVLILFFSPRQPSNAIG